MDVDIDKARCEIISFKIDDFLSASARLLTNRRDRSIFHNDFEPVANSVGKNEARVSKNHQLEHNCV